MNTETLEKTLKIMEEHIKKFKEPIVTQVAEKSKDPFRVLISTILSLRTKDAVTEKASSKLFSASDNPEKILSLSTKRIEELIYPVGFYKTKARRIKEVCRILLEKYNGKVPDELDELLKLPGVGRKTANLVITLGYGKEGICVDTHVHRISNRLGYVKTKTPEETEMKLRKKLPKRWWKKYNDILVTWGQNICSPVSPRCSLCPVSHLCEKVGVVRSR